MPGESKKILVQNTNKKRDVHVEPSQLTTNVHEVIEDPDIDVIIEVMGGIEQTREYLLEALNRKKHVVTANKDLMAVYGTELLKKATDNGCDLFMKQVSQAASRFCVHW